MSNQSKMIDPDPERAELPLRSKATIVEKDLLNSAAPMLDRWRILRGRSAFHVEELADLVEKTPSEIRVVLDSIGVKVDPAGFISGEALEEKWTPANPTALFNPGSGSSSLSEEEPTSLLHSQGFMNAVRAFERRM